MMEKKKCKIKIQYIVAIILGIVGGFGVCRCSANTNWDAPSMYLIYEEYRLHYNPRTFYADVLLNKRNILFEVAWSKFPYHAATEFYIPQMWTEDFLMEIPTIVFRDIYHDDISEWNYSSIRYRLNMHNNEIENAIVVNYRYKKPCLFEKYKLVCIREIEYTPTYNEIVTTEHDFGDDIGFSQEVLKTFISRDEALYIAEAHGGQLFRNQQQLENYTVDMYLYGNGTWEITYEPDLSTPRFRVEINAISGEVSDLHVWPARE